MRKLETTVDAPRTPVITPSAGHITASPNAAVTGLAPHGSGSVELSTRTITREDVATGPEHSTRRERVWAVMSGTREAVLGPPSQVLGLIAFPYVR
ncbi:hypothetical protein [Streptomyces sp. NPDC057494]|uniref:hypothetical protein n=1 Tax=Streptomyces sp. NPDC057494 TaxID=3346148 RepID=UPI0036957166